ncbi:MAG TPA: polyprenyl synthetase family protein [Verrucomicrobiales bacterium]|nr:polyprenyl synthetase family protein [Verrucomicrobiales bacterium]
MLKEQIRQGFLFEALRPDLDAVEDLIRQQAVAFDPGVQVYISYLLDSGGKRFRPALALLAGGATAGVPHDGHRRLGVILELIHVATLVHDDIMDGAELRRKMPTAAAKWGSALSVLLGDCLFAHALDLASRYDNTVVSRAVAAASRDVCTGEILQTQRRFDLNLRREDYFRMIEMKTASLFACATGVGAYLSGASEEVCARLRLYGLKLGSAYQIYDDCLDLIGSEKKAGKTLGTDLAKGKLTLPLILLIEEATEAQKAKLNAMLLQREPVDASVLAGIADYEGAIEAALATSERMLKEGVTALEGLTGTVYGEGLEEIVSYVEGLIAACRSGG